MSQHGIDGTCSLEFLVHLNDPRLHPRTHLRKVLIQCTSRRCRRAVVSGLIKCTQSFQPMRLGNRVRDRFFSGFNASLLSPSSQDRTIGAEGCETLICEVVDNLGHSILGRNEDGIPRPIEPPLDSSRLGSISWVYVWRWVFASARTAAPSDHGTDECCCNQGRSAHNILSSEDSTAIDTAIRSMYRTHPDTKNKHSHFSSGPSVWRGGSIGGLDTSTIRGARVSSPARRQQSNQ